MYKNVGGELKFWAKTLVVISAIPAMLLGIIIFFYGMSVGEGVGALLCIAGVVVGVVGFIFARFLGILLYSFGELVERTVSIDNRLADSMDSKICENQQVHTPPVQKINGAAWVCPICGHQNNAGALFCGKCSHVK